jgi:hypothetical protein
MLLRAAPYPLVAFRKIGLDRIIDLDKKDQKSDEF